MIQGGADACDPPAESEGLDRYFTAGYRRIVIASAGHFPAREAPREVGEAVVAHLRDTASAERRGR
jgi:pimeloyl-ACP methyl ester carboxylesterase